MLLFKKDIVNSLYKCIYFFFSHHKVSLIRSSVCDKKHVAVLESLKYVSELVKTKLLLEFFIDC